MHHIKFFIYYYNAKRFSKNYLGEGNGRKKWRFKTLPKVKIIYYSSYQSVN